MSEGIVRAIADWIASTAVSDTLKAQQWIVPTSQSIHIICISLVFVSSLVISLRLLGVIHFEQSLAAQINKFTKMIYFGVGFLLLTGIVQIVAEPVRQFVAPLFWVKMFLILLVLAMTRFLAQSVRHSPDCWGLRDSRPGWAKGYALTSILLWSAIIFCGRFIGYTWISYA